MFCCSTLSEFENFLLCVRILINVKTKRQANFKDFKRFGAFKGVVEQKNVVFNSFVCKLGLFWHSWDRFTRVLKWPTRAKKGPIYTRSHELIK
jgi:hypothetical protein